LQPVDTLVLANGVKASNNLVGELEGKVQELYVIGDDLQPRKLTEAIRESYNSVRLH